MRNLTITQKRNRRLVALTIATAFFAMACTHYQNNNVRERISINDGWAFMKYDTITDADHLIYDVRPEIKKVEEARPADKKPTEAEKISPKEKVLKSWILPTGNDFIKDESKHYTRPEGNPGNDFALVQGNFDDSSWEQIDLPHDWAVEGPFFEGWGAEVGGGMGRLPSHGIAWYRKKIDIPSSDKGKLIFIDIDGAMSYSMVWVNGILAGGWPYGYNSYRIDITPYVNPGEANQLAIRIDNPNHSSRWYPGGGIYRNVWITKTNPVHVAHWGTYITSENVSKESADIKLTINIDNNSESDVNISTITKIYQLGSDGRCSNEPVLSIETGKTTVQAGKSAESTTQATIKNPSLWGPPPTQKPNLYFAVTEVLHNGKIVDQYETRFGIRSLNFDPERGVIVNGEHIVLKGVNQHHDLGALGAAFNTRAAERQLEILQEMGCNAIRIAHNPPAPELLELTDRMGFLVIDEVFDSWARKKTPHDFHLVFNDWYEQDTRSFIRRDKNCPSVIAWSFGNEVGEQYTGEDGAKVFKMLHDIVKDEDPTRPTTASMNFAKPDMPMPGNMDMISLNYQGEGIRNAPAYKGLRGITTEPLYPAFHEQFPEKIIVSSENAAALSTRGTYLFPVHDGISAPVKDGAGGDPENMFVSAYELYTAPFGSSADKVFKSLDMHPYVAGGFVWSGWDYLGEPTPYYLARSSYFGVIDLAGFKKDRFFLYQSYWRPDYPMAHILPHWNWNGREGEITPVHVFTSGDEAELFLNGESLGKKRKEEFEYRLRWDDVKYKPGELKVVAYKNGKEWAEDVVKTTGLAFGLELIADQNTISANGKDLSFITLKIIDNDGLMLPTANSKIKFSIDGPGEIVATDNGDPRDLTPFPSHERNAFNGLALAIVKAKPGNRGEITIKAESEGLKAAEIKIITK